jgi:Adenylate and Guanylate cyclase catalytic domain
VKSTGICSSLTNLGPLRDGLAVRPHSGWLSDLTNQDLKEIGVSLGHRRQLLRAITELAGREKDAPKAAAAPRDTAERRQVTVMFSDLVGSTALSARMDPEDLREVISAYQKCVAETVQRGFVSILVHSASPRRRENETALAVTARSAGMKVAFISRASFL